MTFPTNVGIGVAVGVGPTGFGVAVGIGVLVLVIVLVAIAAEGLGDALKLAVLEPVTLALVCPQPAITRTLARAISAANNDGLEGFPGTAKYPLHWGVFSRCLLPWSHNSPILAVCSYMVNCR